MDSQSIWDDWGSPEPEKPLKSSGYNSVKMAQYFQDCLIKQPWYSGLGVGNTRALAGQMARWKKSGLGQETLYDMIHRYMDIGQYSAQMSDWKDFIAKRESLLAYVTEPVTKPVDVPIEDGYDEEQAMRDYLARRNK